MNIYEILVLVLLFLSLFTILSISTKLNTLLDLQKESNEICEDIKNRSIETSVLCSAALGEDTKTYLSKILWVLNFDVEKYNKEKYGNIDPTILQYISSDKKIAAIKYYREKTGVNIKEAKEYIEKLMDLNMV